MAGPTHTLDQLRAGVDTRAESRFTAIIERVPIEVAELEDVNFHFNSAVFLPSPPAQGPQSPAQMRVTGLAAIAMALTHAENNPAPELLVAGHTDSVGSAGANRALSARRANNVLAYLQGDATAWAATCEQHVVQDYQLILTWIADEHGFDCDPQGVDGVAGANTRAALDRFRAEFNRTRGGSLPATGPLVDADWQAFFELYDVGLAELLDVQPSELASKRSAFKMMDPPMLACGEDFPVDNVGHDNVRSQINRRVELLFIDDPSHPVFADETPPGRSIYGTPARYARTYLEVEGQSGFRFSV